MGGDERTGWDDCSMLVLKTLERLDGDIRALDEKIDRLTVDLVAIKVKAGLWGAAAGAIPTLVAVLVILLRNT